MYVITIILVMSLSLAIFCHPTVKNVVMSTYGTFYNLDARHYVKA